MAACKCAHNLNVSVDNHFENNLRYSASSNLFEPNLHYFYILDTDLMGDKVFSLESCFQIGPRNANLKESINSVTKRGKEVARMKSGLLVKQLDVDGYVQLTSQLACSQRVHTKLENLNWGENA